MPTVRYEIRNEFGLGNPKLYGAAAIKDDPEALLEGVAMAGLVGLLRQLGDLAEFASGIFHDLHKEVTATASRGDRLMLRVQQVEAEVQSIEKVFLCQSSQTHFAYNMGISWHSKLQMDQNLITSEVIPQFIMDSYEECHSPPQLSMLDKYDVAGAGACLKRYSDPTFFKIELASSGIGSQVEREKRVHKHKEKGSRWSNGQTPGIFSAPYINFKSQVITSNQASEELVVTHMKLKSRHLTGSETSSYLEHLHQVLSPVENCASKNSKSYSPIEMKTIASSESISEVHGISFGASGDIERNPSQSPIVDNLNGMERQRIKIEELPQTLPKHEEGTEGSATDYSSNELKISSAGLQEMDQKELSSDDDWRTEGSSGGYSSDDISSNVDNYIDAHNTMESGVDTDSENNVKPNLSFTTTTQRMNSSTDKELELQTQDSRPDSDEISNSEGRSTSCKTDTYLTPYLYTSADRSDTQSPHRNRITLDVPAHSNIYTNETHEKIPDQWRSCEVEVDPLENSCINGKCSKLQFTSEKSTISSPTKNGQLFQGSAEVSDIFSDASSHVTSQPILMTGNTPENIDLEDYTEGLVLKDIPVTFGRLHHHSEGRDGRMLEVSTRLIEESSASSNFPIGRSQESTKQVFEASQCGIKTLHIHSFSPSKSSISMQTQGLFEEIENLAAPEVDLASPEVQVTLKNTNLDSLSDAEVPQEPNDVDLTKFTPPCSWKEERHNDMQKPAKTYNISKDEVHTEAVALFEHSSSQTAIIEADSDSHGSCSLFSPAASGFCECLQEHIPEDVVLNQNDSEITEKSVPMNLTGTGEVCTPHIPFCPLVEAKLMSVSVFSNSELFNPDLSYPCDAKLSNDVCNTTPSKHGENNLHASNTESTDPYGIEKDFGSVASLCCHQDSAREDMVQSSHLLRGVVKPFEEAPDLQAASEPNIMSFARDVSLKKNDDQSNPIDTMGKLSDSTCEPEFHDTANNVSFTDFLKLTQMDWLLDIRKEVFVDPLQNESFGSEVAVHISQNAKEDLSMSPHFITENTNPFEEASKVQVASEPNMIGSQHDDGLLKPSDFLLRGGQFVGQETDASNSVVAVHKSSQLKSEPESHLISSEYMDSRFSNIFKCGQQLPDSSILSDCIYELYECSLPSNSSNMESVISPGIPENTSLQLSGRQSCEPDAICPVLDNSFQETVVELPPLPPLPPLQWRMGKLQMGHATSRLQMTQSSMGQNLFTALSALDEKPSHGILREGDATMRRSNLFAPLLGFEEEIPQLISTCFKGDSVPSVNISQMNQTGTVHPEEPEAPTLDLSSVQLTSEDDNHLYDLQAFNRGKVHPLNSFISSDDGSSKQSVSMPIPPSKNERSQLDQLLLSLESKKSQHCPLSLDKEKEKPTSQSEDHEPESKIPGGIPVEDCTFSPDSRTPVEDYAFNADSLTIRMPDDEEPKKKLYLLHRPRDPLIEDVASHDKSTLRKVQELVQPSNKSKPDESSTLLGQIRNKSHNLKPTGGVKPNLRGPPTNLKIAAILEKANAIREACIGSDDDDDGDSWSDS